MVPPPGTLLEPAEVQIGALVDARDDSGIWYRARVIDKTGRGARTSVTVRFQRFNQKHDRPEVQEVASGDPRAAVERCAGAHLDSRLSVCVQCAPLSDPRTVLYSLYRV